ncbi:putative hydro-lyase [Geminicoccaceae bacterium 1502E]|nr:putative hydro-lyase [Geminicoccaceae bacterium 1502E]
MAVEGRSGLAGLTPAEARARIASGAHGHGTAGMANGHVQGNVVILPKRYAYDFMAFCNANPKPCPLLAAGEPGDPALPSLGRDIDIRTDVPRYNVYREGVLEREVADLRALWREDLVTFILGCSYSFEEPLLEEGVPVRHIETSRVVPMYRTSIQTAPAGPFGGPLVVSMRPMTPAHAIRAVQVTSRFPSVHGAPVHLAAPEQIGIADIMKPDWGDAPEIRDGEIPVFWACGVTPQAAIERARPEICITHKPGHMLVTDLLNRRLALL